MGTIRSMALYRIPVVRFTLYVDYSAVVKK